MPRQQRKRAAAPNNLREPSIETTDPPPVRRRRTSRNVQSSVVETVPLETLNSTVPDTSIAQITDLLFKRMQESGMVICSPQNNIAVQPISANQVTTNNLTPPENTNVNFPSQSALPALDNIALNSYLPTPNSQTEVNFSSNRTLASQSAVPAMDITQNSYLSTLNFPMSASVNATSTQSVQSLPNYSFRTPCTDSVTTSGHHQIQLSSVTLPAPVASSSQISSFNSCPTIAEPMLAASSSRDMPGLSNANQNFFTTEGTCTFNFLNHPLPLGYHVKDSIRNEIFSGRYIDLATLIPNFGLEDESVLFESAVTTLKMTAKGKHKQILGIIQWCNAFDIFTAIYIEKFPSTISGLLKYGYNIRNLSQRHGFSVAKLYDESFRKAKLRFNLNWSVINDELWREALASKTGIANNTPVQSKQNKQPFLKGSQPSPNKYPNGFCWVFCKSGKCPDENNCKHKHQCVKCGQKHATDTCKKTKGK